MDAEVIDLTKSPPTSPKKPHKSSRILKFTAYIHLKKIRFKVKKSCLMPSLLTFNPNPTHLGTNLFSQATHQPINKEPWTPKEHAQFLMGLMKYGGGQWKKIAKSFVKNKTARQVERHATGFFMNFLETHVSSRAAKASTTDNITLNSNPKNDNKMKEGEEDMGPPQTLVLFSSGETSSSSNNEISEKNTTRTCVADNDNEDDDELDLELRLG